MKEVDRSGGVPGQASWETDWVATEEAHLGRLPHKDIVFSLPEVIDIVAQVGGVDRQMVQLMSSGVSKPIKPPKDIVEGNIRRMPRIPATGKK